MNTQESEIFDKLLKENASLRITIQILNDRIAEISGQSSKNTSKPPSLDQKPNRTELKSKGGAQIGHKAYQRKKFTKDEIDKTEYCTLTSCVHCGKTTLKPLKNLPPRQWIELKLGGRLIVEYVRATYRCLSCGEISTAPLPDNISLSPYGPRLQALIGSLRGNYHLTMRKISYLIFEVLGVPLSCGSVSKIEKRLSDVLEDAYHEIRSSILSSDECKYVDETRWRINGKTAYTWLLSTKSACYYRILSSRSRSAKDLVLGNNFNKKIVTDRYSAYKNIKSPHQYCLCHIKRNCQGFAERNGLVGYIGKQLVRVLEGVFRIHHDYSDKIISLEQYKSRSYSKKRQFSDWLREGYLFANKRFSRFCSQMLLDFKHLWTYLRYPDMEMTNNRAERAIRPIVIWRKMCAGSRSERGAEYASIITSIVQTLKIQKIDILNFLERSFVNNWNDNHLPQFFS